MTLFYVLAIVLLILLVMAFVCYEKQFGSEPEPDKMDLLDMEFNIDLDEYRNPVHTYYVEFDGENYMVMKDGEVYIRCLGSRADAENIVNTLQKDSDAVEQRHQK